MRFSQLALVGATILMGIVTASAQGTNAPLGRGRGPPDGEALFENRCARCHGLKGDGDGGLGPSLIGVVGKPAASRPDFVYSDALKAKCVRWDPAVLDEYLADPQGFAPGTDMDVHSPDPAERGAIIEFIQTLK